MSECLSSISTCLLLAARYCCLQDTLKDWSVVDPLMVVEFQKEALRLMRSTGQLEVDNDLDFSPEPIDQVKRIVYDPSEPPKTQKKVPPEV